MVKDLSSSLFYFLSPPLMNKLDEIKATLGVTEYAFDQDSVLDLSRYMQQQELFELRTRVIINEDLCEVTLDEVLVIFGLMKEAQIGIYKNPTPEKYPVDFILILWKDLTNTWPCYFFKGLKRVNAPETKLENSL